MTEHPHAALVRKGYEAFSRGDMDTLRGMMAADCTHHVPGDSPMSGDFKGIDAALAHYAKMAEETGGTFRVELQHLFVDGRGHVLSVHRSTAERGGRTFDAPGGILFRIVGDKITDLDECVEDLDTVNTFWS
ncbi:nuclear transport factor 2 family protein [Actinacidiphila acididurans]|uniref:Nuclear transport factor 2 family protein n=1 Tax=Actinacidiphila acididurans TaxID=2784346 RepID=A0ABS2TZJ8_9ACTN|nr:nuclear transport factor 2 family protein [Actinacidiphila acididurans]MBM9508768.1 nuclear transport factor 2 family protein [Actinacidiphila acididurans]